MSMYAVKNEDDKLFVVRSNDNAYLYQDQNGNLGRTLYRYYSRKDAQHAIERAGHVNQCHVVELIEAPAKIVVSEEEAKMLKKAKDITAWHPAAVISEYAYNTEKDSDQESLLEDRLTRAYVNGWTVEKPKRYVLPMPDGTSDELDQGKYVAIRETNGVWHGSEYRYDITKPGELEYLLVTHTDIDAAPDWVKAITPVEVTDDEQ